MFIIDATNVIVSCTVQVLALQGTRTWVFGDLGTDKVFEHNSYGFN